MVPYSLIGKAPVDPLGVRAEDTGSNPVEDTMCKVWNKRDTNNIPKDAVYVGRPTIWGNAYSHKSGTLAQHKVATVEEAVQSFERYLLDNIKITPAVLERLRTELGGKDLVCWCAPFGGIDFDDERQICHAQILMRYANEEFHDLDI